MNTESKPEADTSASQQHTAQSKSWSCRTVFAPPPCSSDSTSWCLQT